MLERLGSTLFRGLAVALLLTGCATEPSAGPGTTTGEQPDRDGPLIRVLGTAQDGGLPHASCDCTHCARARVDPARRRLIASLALLLDEPRRTFLIDATPDVREQLALLEDRTGGGGGRVDRDPLDGVFLTHAHMGHYTGLAFFGFEAIHTRGLPVHCTASMAAFLRDNGPWSQLVEMGNVELVEFAVGTPVELGQGLSVEPIQVPHRREFSDTVGFVLRGPRRSVLYVPDTDGWDAWDPPLTDRLAEIDVAILDGTFHSMEELPGRSLESIGHPLIRDSLERLAPLRGQVEIHFTHLNHSNPALDPAGSARREIAAAGFAVLADRAELPL